MAPVRENDVLFAYKALALVEGLSAGARRVGAAIIDHFNRRTGQCDPSVERLAEFLGLHRASVLRCIDELHDLDLIHRVRHGSRTHRNAYLPNWSQFNQMVAEWEAKMRGSEGAADAEIDPDNRPEIPASKVAKMRPSRSQKCDFDSRISATLTKLSNQAKEPIRVCGNRARDKNSASLRSLDGINGLLNGSARIGQSAKPEVAMNGRRQQAAENAAMRRWDDALRSLGPEAYADAVERITPAMAAEATDAEMRKRGGGLKLIRNRLLLGDAP